MQAQQLFEAERNEHDRELFQAKAQHKSAMRALASYKTKFGAPPVDGMERVPNAGAVGTLTVITQALRVHIQLLTRTQ